MRVKPLILIVDDDSNFLEIISAKFNASGFEAATATNEAEALLQSEKLMPDLILMDILMPGASGTDAALAIKQRPSTKNLKIAFLTNLKEPWPTVPVESRKLAAALGMEDFIEKTDDLDAIIKKVREILTRK